MANTRTFLVCLAAFLACCLHAAESLQKVSIGPGEIKSCSAPSQCQILSATIDSCLAFDPATGLCSLKAGQKAKLVIRFTQGNLPESAITRGKIVAAVHLGEGTTLDHTEGPESYRAHCAGGVCELTHNFGIPHLPRTDIVVDYALKRRGTNDQIFCFSQKIKIV